MLKNFTLIFSSIFFQLSKYVGSLKTLKYFFLPVSNIPTQQKVEHPIIYLRLFSRFLRSSTSYQQTFHKIRGYRRSHKVTFMLNEIFLYIFFA